MNSQFTNFVRILLGITVFLFGLNKLISLPFFPSPELPEKAMDFMSSIWNVGLILKVVGLIEMTVGIMLLAKKWIAFSLIVLMPIVLNIILFHLFLDLSGIGGAIFIGLLNGVMLYKIRKQYKPLFINSY